MNKTHGDILHSPTTANGPTLSDLVYRQRLEDTTGDISSNGTVGSYNPPRGEVGWICPVCGRGNAPSTAYCNCKMTKPDIVYLNNEHTIKRVLDNTIDCNSTPPEAYYTTTTTTKISN